MVSAQSFSCVDSNLVNPYYICNEPYNPQCGCDGKIYRSVCAAQYQGGLINFVSFFDGNCGTFDYELVPTLVDKSFIQLSIFLKEKVSVYITIYNIYGDKKYEENLGFVNPPELPAHQIFLNQFFRGMYVIAVQINGETKIKKFVKANNE